MWRMTSSLLWAPLELLKKYESSPSTVKHHTRKCIYLSLLHATAGQSGLQKPTPLTTQTITYDFRDKLFGHYIPTAAVAPALGITPQDTQSESLQKVKYPVRIKDGALGIFARRSCMTTLSVRSSCTILLMQKFPTPVLRINKVSELLWAGKICSEEISRIGLPSEPRS